MLKGLEKGKHQLKKKSTNRGTKKNKFRFNNLICMRFRNSTQHV